MDRARVAGLVYGALAIDGYLVHLHATTHEGVDNDESTPHPRPPRRALRDLLAEVSPEGQFSEQMRETAIDVWRRIGPDDHSRLGRRDG